MTVITELANGNTEVFETNNYVVSKIKDFHPLICKIKIYENGKKIFQLSRVWVWFYKHFTFKTEKIQTILKNIDEQRKNAEVKAQ